MASVESLAAPVRVPYGTFAGALRTAEWNPLEPGSREFKYYAKGVGLVLEEENGGKERIELIAVKRPHVTP
jgi:hypothetical protein